jgi:subtilisin-like proprotein convertase family protein
MSGLLNRLLPFLAALLLAGFAACVADDAPPGDDPQDDFPLTDPDALRAGAPSNDDLPSEGKADEILPASFDLVATQSPVRSQASRGVCSIFGTIALMEHLYIVEGTIPNPDFSEQFLQWSTKFEAREFQNTGGSSAQVNINTLNRFGGVFETDWPYETAPWTATNNPDCALPEAERPLVCHTNGEPPAGALSAPRWRIPRGRWVNSRPESLKSHLYNARTAVQVGGDFYYQAWGHGGSRIPKYSGYRDFGYVVTPSAEDIASSNEHRAGHSFLLVGWDDNLEVQAIAPDGTLAVDASGNPVMQRGFFLFKNSWGTGWATRNPKGAGYGWISYEYVSRYLSAYVSDKPQVSVAEVCNDSRDNDFNGQTDCADAACSSDRACIDPLGSYVNNTPAAIPDNNAAGVSSTIVVAEGGVISSLQVEVDIAHTYVGDLTVRLSKGSTSVTLQEREGAGADDLRKTWDVDEFDGQDAAGTWTLQVIDSGNADTGTLNRWALTITRCAGDDCGSTPTTLTGSNETPVAIPDDDPAGITSAIPITGAGNVGAARVTVNITHPFLADLVVSVSKDGGTPVELLREEYVEDTVLVRTFPVDAFNGQPAAGSWTLHVADVAGGDVGTLNAWSLELVTQ